MYGEVLTTIECAQLAGKHRRTIVNWIRSGWLPATRHPGERGQYRVKRQDLEELLNRPANA